LHDAIRELLAGQGASFWGGIRAASPEATDQELLVALWDLVWAGEVTNDSLAPLRSLLAGGGITSTKRRPARANRARPTRLTRLGPPAGAGRWSLVAPLLEPVPTTTEAAHAQAAQLLERYGVVTRETVLAEGVVGGYASVYPVL
jgi:ATP-dependent Lhr-like helicase